MQLEALKKELIEPRKQDLMYLNLVATDPSCQGRGYGSRLLGHANDIVCLTFHGSLHADPFD
jgi:ribosomal protein S18 acetylase RimI-like enzyme